MSSSCAAGVLVTPDLRFCGVLGVMRAEVLRVAQELGIAVERRAAVAARRRGGERGVHDQRRARHSLGERLGALRWDSHAVADRLRTGAGLLMRRLLRDPGGPHACSARSPRRACLVGQPWLQQPIAGLQERTTFEVPRGAQHAQRRGDSARARSAGSAGRWIVVVAAHAPRRRVEGRTNTSCSPG